ncbi:MAG TPA: hypothetical protein VNN10_00280 [Dehalococcoidia bacterium]|nr:hypothetical protein [Dehalococcoidia bacterium]
MGKTARTGSGREPLEEQEGTKCELCGVPAVPREAWPAPFLEFGRNVEFVVEPVVTENLYLEGIDLGKRWLCQVCSELLARLYDMFDEGGRPVYGLLADPCWKKRVPAFLEAVRDLAILGNFLGKNLPRVFAAAAVRRLAAETRRKAELLEELSEALPADFDTAVLAVAKRHVAVNNRRRPPGMPRVILGDELLRGDTVSTQDVD